MELSAKRRFFKGAVLAALALISVLIQNTPALSIEIGGARCFLVLPVCIVLGIGENEASAALLGLFGGMLWDISSSVHMGFNAIFLCIFCFFSSAFISVILRNTFITNMLFTVSASFLYALLYWLIFIIIKGMDGAQNTLFSFYLPSAIYTAVVSVAVYFAAKSIKRLLNREKKRA
ncbi:MAG: rod shape-determining protein MreD [Clostridiales bacterium]|nr:rod shape-determining protein MreD [Clostridiales bacterium]